MDRNRRAAALAPWREPPLMDADMRSHYVGAYGVFDYDQPVDPAELRSRTNKAVDGRVKMTVPRRTTSGPWIRTSSLRGSTSACRAADTRLAQPAAREPWLTTDPRALVGRVPALRGIRLIQADAYPAMALRSRPA